MASSPPTFVAGVEPPAPKFVSSSSMGVGSVVDALAGDAPRGGVVKGGGMLGVALGGSSCCRSSPAKPGKISIKDSHPKVHQWRSE